MHSTLEDQLETVLVADLGRGYSRGYVLEQVNGDFRFVARAERPTTLDLPFDDLGPGWRSVVEELSWLTGRSVDQPLAANGDGTDATFCVSTLAAPTRVLMIETGLNPSAGPIVEGLQRAHAELLQLTAPSGRKDGGWLAANVATAKLFAPEMIIFIGSGPADAFQRAVQLLKQSGPMDKLSHAVVIADGPSLDQAAAALDGVRVRRVSPSARDAQGIASDIEHELVEAFRARAGVGNFKDAAPEASDNVITRAHAVDLSSRFVAATFGRRVLSLAIDDGSHVHWASGDQGAMSALPGVDLGRAITGLSDQDVRDAAGWLPFELAPGELVNWVLNRSIRPWTTAEQAKDKAIEQALARQILRRGVAEIQKSRPAALSDIDLVIGSARFADWGQPGSAALTLLDCIDQLPNQGVIDLAYDRDGLMTAAGALSLADANLAASVFEHDALTHLGSAVIIGGAANDGDLACRGEIRYGSGETTQFSVASGSIEVLPLRVGETASLTLRPERKYSIGGRPAGETVPLSGDRQLVGGAVGVIVDARIRPLLSSGSGGPAKMKQWLDAVNGNRLSSIRRAL